MINATEFEIRRRLRDDFEHYATKCLKIRTKKGEVLPFTLNKAQRYIHERLETQLREKGLVRALILKGRQQGCSTYVGGRFYWRVTHSFGKRVYILTHEDQATQNLFEMVKRYHEHCPEVVKPATSAENAKELTFPRLDSAYKVGTAGNKGAGRSSTVQLVHGSEVAFWPHAQEHMAGLMQAVPNTPGTEVILESTANGVGNKFHELWQLAESGKSPFQAIFVPWYWQDEYATTPADDLALDEAEQEYQAAYGLSAAQMQWRRDKIAELGDTALFAQEYPANASEAFQFSGIDSFIKPALVVKARKSIGIGARGPLVIGLDPAWTGGDRTVMLWRRGRHVERFEAKDSADLMQTAGWLKRVIDDDKPAKAFIDVGGVGAGVYDRLMEWGAPYSRIVVPINFGSSPFEPVDAGKSGPKNRRAEMWMKMRDWLADPLGCHIPDSDELQADLTAPGYKYDSNTLLLLESKDDMARRGVRSPDIADAMALTFAEPVRGDEDNYAPVDRYKRGSSQGGYNWKTA